MKHPQQKLKGWMGDVARARMDRKNYPAGPAAGPGVWYLYKKYFVQTLRGKRHARVLVLGATPEYRDYALEKGCEVVVVDFSLDMIEKMSRIMKHKNHPNEILVRGNWLDMGYLADNYFDLAVGCGITNNLPPGTQTRFFKELKRVLKKGGHILLHEAVILPRKPVPPLSWYIDQCRKGKLHWFDIFITARFYSDVTKLCQPKKYLYDMGEFCKIVQHYYAQLPREVVENFEKYKGGLTHTIFSENMLLRMMGKYFKLLPTQKAKDYLFCDFMYHILGRVEK